MHRHAREDEETPSTDAQHEVFTELGMLHQGGCCHCTEGQ
eukprot:CAMPEP_0114679806 /NCGR_PEP_ID=MMETSP0191-20121206/53326_1 /TAXON_ID=126664 /ORGANISM="Sorites sp." /LENGTH=39 /DNA_ID= /DNA_START= /DNA_END= /DNA_ORIENTATION=